MKCCSVCKRTREQGATFTNYGAANNHRERNACTNCLNHRAEDKGIIAAVSAGGLEAFSAGRHDRLEAIIATGSVGAAAVALGVEPRMLRAEMRDIMHAAARRGVSPVEDKNGTAPEGFHVKGKSTAYRSDGSVALTWVKTQADRDSQIAMLLDAVRAGLTDLPSSRPIPMPKPRTDDLLAVYPMGDPHLGMLAWPAETGNAFDLAIAERNLFTAVDQLVRLAPACKQALVINCGDFFHADNKLGMTTKGTRVDVDGRWPKVLATGIKLMRRLIDRALEKHEHVTVINEIGNHDDHTSIVLSIALAQFYEHEPRVTIDTSPQPFHWYRFGKVLIGTHHGDKTRRDDLLGVMAVDQRKAWGESEHCYWYIGHIHHDTLKELAGCTVESFRTLAGKDDYHNSHGYRSGRDMKLIIHHKDHGEIGRHTVGISLVHALIAEEQNK